MPKTSAHSSIFLGCETGLQILAALAQRSNRTRPCSRQIPAGHPSWEAMCSLPTMLERLDLNHICTRPLHVFSRDLKCKVPSGCRLHQHTKRVQGTGFIQVSDEVFVASAPFAFMQLAKRLSYVELLRIGYEICGTYRQELLPKGNDTSNDSTHPEHTFPTGAVFNVEPLASTQEIRSFLQRNRSLGGAVKALGVLRFLADGSASPRETSAAILLSLPKRCGGYGLDAPLMNYAVKASREAYAISGRRSFRCDLYWPDIRLDMEYQSREFHQSEASRINDSRRANALRSMGHSVLPVTNSELDSLSSMDVIAKTILKMQGKRLRPSESDYRIRQIRLRRDLGLPIEP